jgi:hypothetical protein
MDTTFHNVLITISAETSKEAYTKLCNALASIDAEYVTDTYSEGSSFEEESTAKLFP